MNFHQQDKPSFAWRTTFGASRKFGTYVVSDTKSTMIASQAPVELWHQAIGDPTLADAILNIVVHDAYQLDIKGESIREAQGIAGSGIVNSSRSH